MSDETEEGSLPLNELLNDTDTQMKSQFQLQQDMLLQNDFMHWRTMPEENREAVEDDGQQNGKNSLETKAENAMDASKPKSDQEQSGAKNDVGFSSEQERQEEEETACHFPLMFASTVNVDGVYQVEFLRRYRCSSWKLSFLRRSETREIIRSG